MTPEEWERCADPQAMLESLRRGDGASERKLRLFPCGCARRVAHLLHDPHSRTAVEVAERFAEALAGAADFRAAAESAGGAVPLPYDAARAGLKVASWYAARAAAGVWPADLPSALWEQARFVAWASGAAAATDGLGWDDPAWDSALRAAWVAIGSEPPDAEEGDEVRTSDAVWEMGWESFTPFPGWASERWAQASLLRDLLGPLPLQRVSLDPAWLAWHGGGIPKLAQAVYEQRALPSGHLDAGRLAVLADMLEEAGCTDAELLAHLRSPGPHVRGCWVLDLLLNKE